jgi:hypothetical protein
MLASALALAAASQGLVMTQGYAAAPAARASTPTMRGVYPKGPFGDYAEVGDTTGWVGDQSQGTQIKAFEAGDDYLFFQGPSPKTAIQEDLPGLFTGENLAAAEITPLQIGVTVVGLGTFATLVPVLLS